MRNIREKELELFLYELVYYKDKNECNLRKLYMGEGDVTVFLPPHIKCESCRNCSIDCNCIMYVGGDEDIIYVGDNLV